MARSTSMLAAPSDRVQSGTFGAVLMRDPDLVARCCDAMRDAVDVEITVKCRIGVDDQDPAAVLPDFIERVAAVGVNRVAIHARKAWLEGLSPKENRDVPPLDYDLVLAMKARFPELHLSVNGGIETLDQAKVFLDKGMDGVMIGRAAYHQPADILARADAEIFGIDTPPSDPVEVARKMLPYIEAHLAQGGKLAQVTRHMLGLFSGGRPGGARAWRRVLSEGAHRNGAGPELVEAALEQITGMRGAA